MNNNAILSILKDCSAILDGHFLLSSGKHSSAYVQCAKLLRYPWEAEKVMGELAKKT